MTLRPTQLVSLVTIAFSPSLTFVADADSGICHRAGDLAFIRPDFIHWYISRQDPGDGCVVESFEPPYQWGLPGDQFLAGEPLNAHRDGFDEIMICRPDYGDPNLLRWWILHNDQLPGYSGSWTECLFGLAGDKAVIVQPLGSTIDRLAVWRPGLFIVDTNHNCSYDDGIDEIHTWGAEWGADDRLLSIDVTGNFEHLVVRRTASSAWEFYAYYMTPSDTPSEVFSWGSSADIPAVADVNGDGREDLLLFRPSNGRVYVELWESGDPFLGFSGTTDCTLDLSGQLADQNGGDFGWGEAFVGVNFDGSDDSDGDGVPDCVDQCEGEDDTLDCNGNGVPDCVDIQSGASQDLNGNGIPDECEPPMCDADVVGDGVVNTSDMLAILAAWGTSDPDFDIAPSGGDGVVDVQDLLVVLASWGPCD